MYRGKIFHTKTGKVFIIVVIVVAAVALSLLLTNVISLNVFSLSMFVYLVVGLLTAVLMNRHERKQTDKRNPSLNALSKCRKVVSKIFSLSLNNKSGK